MVHDQQSWEDAVAAVEPTRVVLLLPRVLSKADQDLLEQCASTIARHQQSRVCLISSFTAHLGDELEIRQEHQVVEAFQEIRGCHVAILRAGHMPELCEKLQESLVRLAPLRALATSSWKSCFLSCEELVATTACLFEKTSWPKLRTFTVLGKNQPLQEVLAEHGRPTFASRSIAVVARLFSAAGLGAMLAFAARFKKSCHQWRVDALQPSTTSELLALYNPFNCSHVAIAGYNTGVVHFGWKFPGKTVIKTIETGKRVRVGERHIDVDAGVTLKRANAALTERNQEFFVLPNYSYISMGTTFFVPIHGSGSDVSTLGETIDKVVLYDPQTDRIIRSKRGDSTFRHAMYDTTSGMLALRLRFRTRPQSRYYVRKEILESPTASQLWDVFTDSSAANIELRKSRAADAAVEISRYFTSVNDADQQLLEVPKDSIGKLWDRLEENRVTSFLFHALVRHFGFHVELFLDADQFPVFWQAHQRPAVVEDTTPVCPPGRPGELASR